MLDRPNIRLRVGRGEVEVVGLTVPPNSLRPAGIP
jgi:hypothetical protein